MFLYSGVMVINRKEKNNDEKYMGHGKNKDGEKKAVKERREGNKVREERTRDRRKER